MSWQESSFFQNEPEVEQGEAPRARSWTQPAGQWFERGASQLGRRSSASDAEEPLLDRAGSLPSPVQSAEPGRSPTGTAPWPALRLSSLSTRRLNKVSGSWGDGEQVATPLAGGFPTPFLAQPSPRHQDSIPFLSPVAAAAPLQPAGAAGGGESGAAPPAAGIVIAGKGPTRGDQLANAAVCGSINAIIALPIMLSFAAIIFRDPFFQPLLGSLVKIVFLSSALHQLAFTLFSSLPFAVGQVQDVGLIFLSAMATDVVAECQRAGVAEADTLGTALSTLTLSTALVGLLIIATGLLKLASLVQYVPLPVVGGYLAYVGYFCMAAGISLASGVQVSTPQTFVRLADSEALIKLAPAVALTVLIALTLRRFRSPLALPLLLVATPLAFYGALWACGLSLADAREAGWVAKPQEGAGEWEFWRAWGLYNIRKLPPDNIFWGAMPSQAGKLVALYFVVAFGSSMDVAAIQAESPRDLDFNQELTTVGVSNLVAGACGVGFTGSYIFSQTLFSMRMGVESGLMGAIIIVAELAVFMLPVDVMTFLPNFFFGALVMWIGQDIMKDWLFIAAKRVSAVEYALLWGTLLGVMALGLEAGIVAGIVAAAVHFAYCYARVTVTAFSVVPSRSGAVRTFEQRTALEMFAARITAVSLTGFLFFGSSVKVSEQVIKVAAATLEPQPHQAKAPPVASSAHFHAQQQQQERRQQQRRQGEQEGVLSGEDGAAALEEGLLGGGATAAVAGPAQPAAGLNGLAAALPPAPPRPRPLPTVVSGVALDDTYDAISHFRGLSRDRAAAALEQAPRFLILDFRRVQGLDATAARTFVTLHTKLQRMGIQLIITHLPASRPGIRKLLVAQGLILRHPTEQGSGDAEEAAGGPGCRWFETMEAGLQWCEEQFLEVAVAHHLCKPTPTCITLAEVLRSHLEFPRSILPHDLDVATAAAQLARFTRKEDMEAGQVLFERSEPSDDIYIVECGSVLCAVDYLHASVHSRASDRALPADLAARHSHRVLKYGPGGIVGELDFFLQRPRSFSAVCEGPGTVWRLPRHGLERMARELPQVLALLQTIILRSTCLSAAHALEALERSSPE